MTEEFTLRVQKLTAQEPIPSSWREFGKEPLRGVYWVCGVRPEISIGLDEDGSMIGFQSNDPVDFVSLVEIHFEPGGYLYDVNPVNELLTGGFDDDHSITHYMPFSAPPHSLGSCQVNYPC